MPLAFKLILFFSLILLSSGQWSAPSQVTKIGTANASNIENMMQEIAVVGSTVHVVWTYVFAASSAFTPLNASVWYKQSVDNGATWGNEVMISPNASVIDGNAYIVACGSDIHIVFWRNPYNSFNSVLPSTAVMYRSSNNGGSTWNAEQVISPNQTFWGGIACSGNYVYIALETRVTLTPYNTDLFMAISNDSGASFGNIFQLTNAVGRSEDPAMIAIGSSVYLAWNDNRDTANSSQTLVMYGTASCDYGVTWSPQTPFPFSTSPANGYSPAVCGDGNTAYALQSQQTTNLLLFYNESQSGNVYSQSLTIGPGQYPTCTSAGNMIHVVSPAYGTVNITYFVSSNGGASFTSSVIAISNSPKYSSTSFAENSATVYMALSGNYLHLWFPLWNATTNSFQMYYMNNPTANTGVPGTAPTGCSATPTTSGPAPTPSGPAPTPSGPVPTPSGPAPTPYGPSPTPYGSTSAGNTMKALTLVFISLLVLLL
jgi:hypothetical protein